MGDTFFDGTLKESQMQSNEVARNRTIPAPVQVVTRRTAKASGAVNTKLKKWNTLYMVYKKKGGSRPIIGPNGKFANPNLLRKRGSNGMFLKG